ncbi:hypothetical protein [Anaerocolumna jejuensis]|uniref:hypothetical protein n=1 Tax=Anaerocolumna jejuensis TaxID=259063 RepID=UPI003F7C62C4
MYQLKNVIGFIEIDKVINKINIEIDKDTVYIRSNIKQFDDNAGLYQYDELQMTYEEYEKYKEQLYLEDVNILKEKVGIIDKRVNQVFDIENAALDELKIYKITKSKENLESYLVTHPIISSCHGGLEKQYSITKEKQTLLTQMILITQVSINAGQTYHPSWNAQGEPCTYDWTLQELQQLAFETEAVVRPLVSHQQTMEALINEAYTKEEVISSNITFGE